MLNKPLSLFHFELLDFLRSTIAMRCSEEGFDDRTDRELQAFIANLPKMSLSDALEKYQYIFNERGPLYIEKQLYAAIPAKDFVELKVARYYPRLYRGIPRLFYKDNPTVSRLYPKFNQLPSLKKQAVTKAVLHYYDQFSIEGKISLLGKSQMASQILKARFPQLDIECAPLEKELTLQVDDHSITMGQSFGLGLHFLEKGILVPQARVCPVVQDALFLQWRKQENHFFLADLATATGGLVYLHALLKFLEHDPKDIDLCIPNLSWFIELLETKQLVLGVAHIEVYFKGQTFSVTTGVVGKTLRIFASETLSESDLLALIVISGPFVGICKHTSFSHCAALGKVFFYDAKAKEFIRDLLSLAENRLKESPSAISCIRSMWEALLLQIPKSENAWVDDSHFQERKSTIEIAFKLGEKLKTCQEGFKQLGSIIVKEFSANSFLCHLVQRAFCHKQFPEIKEFEETQMDLFAQGKQTFKELMHNCEKLRTMR